jgi:hypothetical protein
MCLSAEHFFVDCVEVSSEYNIRSLIGLKCLWIEHLFIDFVEVSQDGMFLITWIEGCRERTLFSIQDEEDLN